MQTKELLDAVAATIYLIAVTKQEGGLLEKSGEGYAPIVPRLIRREDGGWLAVSPDDSWLHIGVMAWSRDDARSRFDRELREWIVLLGGHIVNDEQSLLDKQ